MNYKQQTPNPNSNHYKTTLRFISFPVNFSPSLNPVKFFPLLDFHKVEIFSSPPRKRFYTVAFLAFLLMLNLKRVVTVLFVSKDEGEGGGTNGDIIFHR